MACSLLGAGCRSAGPQRLLPPENRVTEYAPELPDPRLAPAPRSVGGGRPAAVDSADAAGQDAALVELEERINAARSIA